MNKDDIRTFFSSCLVIRIKASLSIFNLKEKKTWVLWEDKYYSVITPYILPMRMVYTNCSARKKEKKEVKKKKRRGVMTPPQIPNRQTNHPSLYLPKKQPIKPEYKNSNAQ